MSSETATATGGGMVVHAGEALFTVPNDGSYYEFTANATNAGGTAGQSLQSTPALQVPGSSTTGSSTTAS